MLTLKVKNFIENLDNICVRKNIEYILMFLQTLLIFLIFHPLCIFREREKKEQSI